MAVIHDYKVLPMMTWFLMCSMEYLFSKRPDGVMKVIKTGTGLELQGINAKEGVKEEQLKPYFSKVEVVSELDEESGEINESYHVTIDDKKLKKYSRKSPMPTRVQISITISLERPTEARKL